MPGLRAQANSVHYDTAKHGIVGIMRSIANEFAAHRIRVNSVHPTLVNTLMIQNEQVWRLFDPGNPRPTRESATPVFETVNAAYPVGGAGRHQQRGLVPGLRRSPLHHRRHPPSRCRGAGQVTDPGAGVQHAVPAADPRQGVRRPRSSPAAVNAAAMLRRVRPAAY